MYNNYVMSEGVDQPDLMVNTSQTNMNEVIEIIADKECLMGRHGLWTYMQETEEDKNADGWVACDRCNSLYHKQCVGVGFQFGKNTPFLCCGTNDTSIM